MADHGCRFGSSQGGFEIGHGGQGPRVGGSGCGFGSQRGSFGGPFGPQFGHHHMHHHGFPHLPHQHGFPQGQHQHGDQHGPHQHGFPHLPHHHRVLHGPQQQSHFIDRPNFEESEDSMPECVNEIFGNEYDHQCHRGHCKKDMKHKRHHFHHSKKVHKNSLDPVWTIVEKKNGKFTICIALCKKTKPEDVKLNVRERDIYIEIKMEKQSEDGTSQLSQVFTKKVALPEEVEVEEIKSTLTPERVLKIEASIPILEEIDIPVNVDEDD